MKSAYELAMERLNKSAPTVTLTSAQKAEIAELESQFAAKIAAREIALKAEISKVADDPAKADELREQLAHERKKLQAELEEKKRAARERRPGR
jgi:septin family protein